MKSQRVTKLMLFILILLILQIIYQDMSTNTQETKWIDKLEVSTYAKQLIIVAVAKEEAVLSLYEKNEDGKWMEILSTVAVIGKNGIGKSKEGDMKTPVGAFRFTKAFGILECTQTKIDYVQVDESHYWVDDVNSKYYNQFITIENVEPDWTSAEHICEYGDLYHYVLATSYNQECFAGLGSAVFLHCASEETKYTAGCVAIPEEYMLQIVKRVEEDCVLIIDALDNLNIY